MPMTVQPERGNIYRFDVRGIWQARDFAAGQAALVDEMDRVGAVRLLFLPERFEGWATQGDRQDPSFCVRKAPVQVFDASRGADCARVAGGMM